MAMGQLSHFNLLGADRIQVMRGPFSALYGNSSGGVVQIWSSPGTEEFSARLRAATGSYSERSYGAQVLGTTGLMDYNLSASRFETDGYRDQSAAKRDSVNLRLGFDTGESRSLAVVLNYLDIPEAQDPLGVTEAEWRADPRVTTSVATQFNTRKSVEQLQGGVVFEQRFGGNQTLHAMAYTGNRKVVQFLAIPAATQANALHSGGVVDLDTDYRGADLRWSWHGELLDRPLEVTLGGNYDLQDQLRLGYNNFVGTTLGIRGTLRRDETNRIDNYDEFAQAMWQFADRWSVLAGMRHTEVNFKSTDRYIVGPNGNDGGSTKYGDTTAVGGIMFRPVESLRLYVSVGDGFENTHVQRTGLPRRWPGRACSRSHACGKPAVRAGPEMAACQWCRTGHGTLPRQQQERSGGGTQLGRPQQLSQHRPLAAPGRGSRLAAAAGG